VRTLAPSLWERRAANPDWIQLRVGLKDTTSAVAVAFGGGGDQDLRQAAESEIGRHRVLAAVPMVLSLGQVGVLGLHGERPQVNALARWLAVQVAVLHSPEQVVVAAAVPAKDRQEWA